MQRNQAAGKATASGAAARESGVRKMLAAAAFFLLATALAVRPILGEFWTVRANDLVSPSPLWWNNSPAVMYIAHIVASAGILLGVLWMVHGRRPWRFSGLELPAGLLVLAALVSVPAASDLRLAINVAVGTILPLIAAGVLYQMLVTNHLWRRALLAAVIAAAAANCFVSWRQQTSEYEDTYKQYMADKDKFWASQGKSPNAPEVAIYEARLRSHQPSGYFYLANVMASFLLLGLAGTAAAVAGLGWSRLRGRAVVVSPAGTPENSPEPALSERSESKGRKSWVQSVLHSFSCSCCSSPFRDARTLVLLAAAIALAALAICQFIVIRWVGSAGAVAGLAGGVGIGLVAWLLRRRPIWSAAICLTMLAALQAALVVLSMNAPGLYPKWASTDGKLKSLAVRLNYWEGAVNLFAQHPIRGVGPGQFGKRYLAVKPIYASEEVAYPHNWLLNVAAEWGILGLLGTIIALVLPGWKILTALAPQKEPGTLSSLNDEPHNLTGSGFKTPVRGVPLAACPPVQGSQTACSALLLSVGLAFTCCLVSLPGIVPAGSAVFDYMSVPLRWMLAVAAIASLSGLFGRTGAFILFGGLAAFFVHSTVEMGSGVAAAAWPFWACLALTLAWAASGAAQALQQAQSHKWRLPTLIGAAVAAVMVLWLTYAPLTSLLAMNRAHEFRAANLSRQAISELTVAAQADPLDPAPHVALGMIYQQAASGDRRRMTQHLQEAVKADLAAVHRDPLDNMLLHDLGLARAGLASLTQQPADWDSAIEAMQQAVDLYPKWPLGHLRLAGLLAAASEPPHLRRDLAEAAIRQMDTALDLDARWPREDARRFTSKEIEEIRTRRAEVAGWLQ